MSLLPNGLIARTYFARGALLWACARALLAAVFLLGHVNPIRLTFGAIILVIAVVIGLGAADVHRRHERAFLENLGLSRASLVAFFGMPALLGEIVIATAAAMRV